MTYTNIPTRGLQLEILEPTGHSHRFPFDQVILVGTLQAGIGNAIDFRPLAAYAQLTEVNEKSYLVVLDRLGTKPILRSLRPALNQTKTGYEVRYTAAHCHFALGLDHDEYSAVLQGYVSSAITTPIPLHLDLAEFLAPAPTFEEFKEAVRSGDLSNFPGAQQIMAEILGQPGGAEMLADLGGQVEVAFTGSLQDLLDDTTLPNDLRASLIEQIEAQSGKSIQELIAEQGEDGNNTEG